MANREKGAQVGVAIFQNNNLNCNVKNSSSANISPKTSNYRPPWKQISETLGWLLKLFNGRTIVTGDFNEQFVDWVSFISTSHIDIESSSTF